MARTIEPVRFELTQLVTEIAGAQPHTLDAHIHTRASDRRRRPVEVVTLTLPGLVIYAHDLACVRAFATAWRSAAGFADHVLPQRAPEATGPGPDRNGAGVILRVHGAPGRQQVNAIPAGASPTGLAHVRVAIGVLITHAYDLAAIASLTTAWEAAETTAARIWAEPDAFTRAETRERERIARTGRASPTRR